MKKPLSETHTVLAAEWHPSLNLGLGPDKVLAGSHKKVWWLGKCGHEWQTALIYRSGPDATGCPYCSGQKLLVGFNDLAIASPDISAEWHPSKNAGLKPSDVYKASSKRIWWLCKENHEWEATVSSRYHMSSGCPYCSGRRVVVGVNDLASRYPALAQEWSTKRNGDLIPENFSVFSGKKIWWECTDGHEWKAVISNRSLGSGCPICSNKSVQQGVNDLQSLNPELAKEWNNDLNGNILPTQFTVGSDKRVWWTGKCNHEWQASIKTRSKGSGCPFCAKNRNLPGETDLVSIYPELALELHPMKNLGLDATLLSSKNIKKVWWLGKCGHEWQARVHDRANGSNCPFCFGKSALAGFNDLATLAPLLAAEWNFSLNKNLKPDEIRLGSAKKVWWLGKCGHEWQATPLSRSGKDKTGCPFCSGRRVLQGLNDLLSTNPLLAAQWDFNKNIGLTPSQINKGSDKKVWWLGECGHNWQASIKARVNGTNCPYCAGTSLLSGFNDLETLLPDLAKTWHPLKNLPLKPSMVSPGSHRKVWWLDEFGHEWEAALLNRKNGSQCPTCAPGGYDVNQPSTLYFIKNPKHQAFKVGVTNSLVKNNRIAGFKKSGWTVVATWDLDSGQEIIDIETAFFRWLRKDLKIPVYLEPATMKSMGGATETFSDSILTEQQVINKVVEIMQQKSEDLTR